MEEPFMPNDERNLETMPDGALGLIPLESCKELGLKVDQYLVGWREKRQHQHQNDPAFKGYRRDSYIISTAVPRFGTGEAKGVIKESVRGYDLYLMVDVTNYSLTYSVCGYENHMSPDDHYADLKRIIAAVEGKARRVSVIMPMLYEGRQHKRAARESLDCAMMLQELVGMGVSNIITFDAHDSRIQNAVPLSGFDDVRPAYQMIKALVRNVPDISIDKEDLMFISPDEGAMGRSMYYASVLGLDVGMFYKRRNYSVIVNGKNPIEAHEYLGKDLTGKDAVIVDDMIASGESLIDVAAQLKDKGVKRIFNFATFGLFTEGFEKFDKAYEDGLINKIFTTNLIYHHPDLPTKPWYCEVNMCKYVAYIIDTLNHDNSISSLLNPVQRIHNIVEKHKAAQGGQIKINFEN